MPVVTQARVAHGATPMEPLVPVVPVVAAVHGSLAPPMQKVGVVAVESVYMAKALVEQEELGVPVPQTAVEADQMVLMVVLALMQPFGLVDAAAYMEVAADGVVHSVLVQEQVKESEVLLGLCGRDVPEVSHQLM